MVKVRHNSDSLNNYDFFHLLWYVAGTQSEALEKLLLVIKLIKFKDIFYTVFIL